MNQNSISCPQFPEHYDLSFSLTHYKVGAVEVIQEVGGMKVIHHCLWSLLQFEDFSAPCHE